MGARNVQRDFRKVMNTAGLVGREWTPRELRQSFVSLLSDKRVPLEVISRLVGHVQPPSRRLSIVSSCGRSSKAEPTLWTGSFPPTADSGP
jgi:hypothetical protein